MNKIYRVLDTAVAIYSAVVLVSIAAVVIDTVAQVVAQKVAIKVGF